MFDNLTDRLVQTFKQISGKAKLSEENIQQITRDVRLALIEADVALPVVKTFVNQVKDAAIGQDVGKSLKPQEAFIKIVNDQLIHALGDEHQALNLKTQPPAVILMAGLQGSGKTTSAAKLAKFLQEKENKKVMLVSADIYRPAAIKQLQLLAEQIGATFYPSTVDDKPKDIVNGALSEARKTYADVLIIDTAGRLHIDHDMMEEIKQIHQLSKPIETLFVVDSMTGQDAANTAKAFHDALPLTGVVLTKTDGDARGGAALSVKQITGKPIKFMGRGEKIEALEPFHPDRVASQILGMGDMLSLIEQVESKAEKAQNQKLAQKIKKGKNFDLNDFMQQIQQMNEMGGISSMIGKLPGMKQMGQQAMGEAGEKAMKQTVAIISSMTPKERRIPKIISGSRKKRIAKGSGVQIPDVNRLLKQFEQMQRMMKKFSKPGGMKKMMRGLGGLMGGMPGNMMPPDDFLK
ncbi:signal recognition particle protein [Legionella sp. W05-934-2]|jgi:signal recognition particle subunit SRP54|uniref:signal recognition particle protein n=1 Tax=Legionella sp. W05-934-2 TaxID=1198649 RepID=UPI00346193B5